MTKSNEKIKQFYSITEIVGAVYCEQKVVLDRERGDTRPLEIRSKAIGGTLEHLRFEAEGKTQMAIDRVRDQRCFVATAVYGPFAEETEYLRTWRDRVLLPYKAGKLLVSLYYVVSPYLLQSVRKFPFMLRFFRWVLDRFLSLLGFIR